MITKKQEYKCMHTFLNTKECTMNITALLNDVFSCLELFSFLTFQISRYRTTRLS